FDGVALLMVWLWAPQWTSALAAGMGLGLLYLLSLRTNSRQPIPKAQFAFSLVRACLMAAAIVMLGDSEVLRTIIVISGCFSYKIVLFGIVLVRLTPFPRQKPVRSGKQAGLKE